MDRDKIITISSIVLLAVALASSFLLHMNSDVYSTIFGGKKPYENIYTDIVDGIYNPLFRNTGVCDKARSGSKDLDRWFKRELLLKYCNGEDVYPLPYRDYKFEYPPITGFTWILSTYTVFSLGRLWVGGNPLQTMVGETIHYIIQSIVLSIAAIWVFIEYYRLLNRLDTNHKYLKLLILPILPSFIVYSIYNWDLLATAFALSSLRLLVDKRYLSSGLMIGLSVSAKLLPVSIALVVGYELYSSHIYNRLYRYVAGFTLGVSPYAIFMLFPNGFIEFLKHHAGWYCENCIYMYLLGDIWSPYHRILALMSIAIALTIIAVLPWRSSEPRYVVSKACLAVSFTILLNYVFSPQMILLIAPFILLVIASLKELVTYIIADLCNALIMIYWFKEMELRKTLSFLGIPLKYSPWTPDSPIQLIAFTRNILILVILLSVGWRTLTLSIETSIEETREETIQELEEDINTIFTKTS